MYQAKGGIFAGDLLLDVLDANGAQTGERDVGETVTLTIDPMKITQKQRFGHRLENHGDIIGTVITGKPQSLKFSLGDHTQKNRALAAFGDDVVINVAAATITSENVVARLGKAVKLSKMKLKTGADAPVVKDAATGLITYVEGVDYEIDYTFGMITALAGGAITEAEALHVDFKCNAYTGYNITAATKSGIDVLLRLRGKNLETGKYGMLIVYKAALTPTGSVDFITEDYKNLDFSADIKNVGGKTWEFIELD